MNPYVCASARSCVLLHARTVHFIDSRLTSDSHGEAHRVRVNARRLDRARKLSPMSSDISFYLFLLSSFYLSIVLSRPLFLSFPLFLVYLASIG